MVNVGWSIIRDKVPWIKSLTIRQTLMRKRIDTWDKDFCSFEPANKSLSILAEADTTARKSQFLKVGSRANRCAAGTAMSRKHNSTKVLTSKPLKSVKVSVVRFFRNSVAPAFAKTHFPGGE